MLAKTSSPLIQISTRRTPSAVALDRGDKARYQVDHREPRSVPHRTRLRRPARGTVLTARQQCGCNATGPWCTTCPRIDDSEIGPPSSECCLACWSAGFGTVNVATALADAGPWSRAGTTSSSSTNSGAPSAPDVAWSTGSTPSHG